MKNPQDRIKAAALPVLEAVGGRLLGGGFSFGEYDLALLIEAPHEEAVAAVAAGGAVRSSKTTKLLSGDQSVSALKKTADVAKAYKPSK